VEKFTLPSLFEKLFTIHSKVRYNVMNEMKKITLTARKSDLRKIIQNLLGLAVANFEESGKSKLIGGSTQILADEPEKALILLSEYVKEIEEYNQQIATVIELVEEHMFLDDGKISINFEQGAKIPMDDINAMLAESKAEKDELKRQIKDKLDSNENRQEK
tara:strand:- start:174 stop:656 length:483 start_codon:yes stop_codon:yes gene_type:complete